MLSPYDSRAISSLRLLAVLVSVFTIWRTMAAPTTTESAANDVPSPPPPPPPVSTTVPTTTSQAGGSGFWAGPVGSASQPSWSGPPGMQYGTRFGYWGTNANFFAGRPGYPPSWGGGLGYFPQPFPFTPSAPGTDMANVSNSLSGRPISATRADLMPGSFSEAPSDDDDVGDEDFVSAFKSYKGRVDLAFHILDKSPPSSGDFRSRFLPDLDSTTVRYNLDEDLSKGFAQAWEFVGAGPCSYLPLPDRFKVAGEGSEKAIKSGNSLYRDLKVQRWYRVHRDPVAGLEHIPLNSRSLDKDFELLFPKRAGNLNNTPVTMSMDLVGASLKILNQLLFFTEASDAVMDGLADHLTESGTEGFQALKSFCETRNRSVCDLVSLLLRLQAKLLIARRQEILELSDLDKFEKSLLTVVSPLDEHDRLFSGVLSSFKLWKDKKDQASALTRVLNPQSDSRKSSKRTGSALPSVGDKRSATSGNALGKISSFRDSRKFSRSRPGRGRGKPSALGGPSSASASAAPSGRAGRR